MKGLTFASAVFLFTVSNFGAAYCQDSFPPNNPSTSDKEEAAHSSAQVAKQVVLAANTASQTAKGQGSEVQQLPEVVVSGSQLKENAPIGPYDQPEWTTERRFPTTRVYLQQPPWGYGFEQWVKAQSPRGEKPNYLFQEEFEIGLPHRFQLDIYENWTHDSDHTQHDSISTELRWAMADWGKIPLNPTLYGEWTFQNHDVGADRYELKLLLGDDLLSKLHWGLNLIYEQEVGQSRTTEYGLSYGIGYTVVDSKLSLGAELKLESATEEGFRSDPPLEVDLGPSIQWRPLPNVHLDVVPLFGLNHDSPHVETWLVLGVDFGPGHRERYEPVSTRSN